MMDDAKRILNEAILNIAEHNDKFDVERFNAYQKPIIEQMLQNFIDGKHTILVAPTGSGKSIMSLLYCYVVSRLTCESTAILASDTFLQAQYVDSHKTFTQNLMSFGMLKGKANYMCTQNMQPYPAGICAIRDISVKDAIETMPCADNCPYIQAYLDAAEANVKVLNYHLYMSYANFVGESAFTSNLSTLVFDECHKIDEIVDSFATKTLPIKWLQPLKDCVEALSIVLPEIDIDEYVNFADESLKQWALFAKLVLTGASNEALQSSAVEMLSRISSRFRSLSCYDKIAEVYDKYKKAKSPGPLIELILEAYETAKKSDLLVYDVKGYESDKFVVSYDANKKVFNMTTIDTKFIFNKYLLRNTNEVPLVLMSATVGNVQYFIKHLGLSDVEVIRMDSSFDFSKSPIIAVQPLLSMSHYNIDNNLPQLAKYVDYIANAHSNQNGIIHTSNKRIAAYLLANCNCSKRMLSYSNSHEKQQILKMLNADTNYIVVAYSMEEGVDLKDDLCRFQIIAKLSWAYIGDLIVKRKMEVYPEWYTMTTLNTTLQSIGRGNRHANDYCITYITDTSFVKIANACDEVTQKRFVDMFYDQIDEQFVNDTFG